MELHVPDATHGLDLRLEGGEVVVVSVVSALKQVLVPSVPGVLITHPPETQRGGVHVEIKQRSGYFISTGSSGDFTRSYHLNYHHISVLLLLDSECCGG